MEIGPPEPGDLGWLIGLHGSWYAQNLGHDTGFEVKVASIAIDVATRQSPPLVSMLVARDQTGPLATISADGEDIDADGWPYPYFYRRAARIGRGIGQRILGTALDCLR